MEVYLVSGGDDVKLWDCSEFVLAKQFNPHDQNISSLSWSHDNGLLASVSQHSKGIAVTSVKTMGVSTLDSGTGCLCLDLNETSRYMLSGGSDGLISVWDIKSKKVRKTYKDHKGAVLCAKFNHNSSSIASGSESGEIIVYNVITGQGCRPLVTQQAQAIKQLQYNKFKRSLLGSVSDSGNVSLWDCNTRQLINTFPSHKAPATGLSFSPINDILLMSVGLDKRITCQDMQSKKIVKTMIAESPLTSIDTLHDGVTVVVGSTRGKIYQYDLRMSSMPVRTLEGHKSSVQCLRFQNEIQSEVAGNKTLSNKQSRHRQLPVSPRNNSSKDVATPSHQAGRPVTSQGQEDIFSPLREGFHDESSKELIEFQTTIGGNLSVENHTSSAVEGFATIGGNLSVENHTSSAVEGFAAGGIFSPLNDNTTGRSSSGLSPRAVNSYSPYIEQRNNSGQVPIDYNRINSQIHTSPNLNSHAPVGQHSDIQNGLPAFIAPANENVAPTEAPPTDLHSQSAAIAAISAIPTSNVPSQSSSQKQVAFTEDDSDPYAFLTTSDSSGSHSPEGKRPCISPQKTGVSSSQSIPRMHLDESPGSVSGSHMENVRPLDSQTEGVSAEACAANSQISSSRQTDSRPTNLEFSRPLSGDMAVLAHVVRSVVQEEFMAMKRDIVQEVKDEIDDTRDQLHRDIINLQAEMLRMFQIHQNEMMSLIQQYSINEELIAEIQRLQDENKKLRKIF